MDDSCTADRQKHRRGEGEKMVSGREGQFTQVHVEWQNYRSLIACVQESKTLCGVSTVTFMCVCDVPAMSTALKPCSCSILRAHVHLKGEGWREMALTSFPLGKCLLFQFCTRAIRLTIIKVHPQTFFK